MSAQGKIFLLLLLLCSMLVVVLAFLDRTLDRHGNSQQSDRTINIEQESTSTSMQRLQMTPEYRSVTVTGIIKNIYMANSINYLELLVKEGGQNISITFEVGANNKLIGYNSPQLRDSTIRNLWRRIKVSSLKDSVKEGDNIKIETMTWMQSDSLCGDVQSCRDNFTIFKKYEKANSRIDKFLFDKANSEFTNPEPLLRSTEILGPVITISHII